MRFGTFSSTSTQRLLRNHRLPSHLTIAGRGIPDELREFVKKNEDIAKHVTFLESPPTIEHLFEQNRVFIAPHLYGAGIQYKVSEALAVGIPVVMSTFIKESFGDIPGCVGSDSTSFTKCIIDLHGNKRRWEALRDEGISYIQQTHSRKESMEKWSEIIDHNFNNVSKEGGDKLFNVKISYAKEKCVEGEEIYLSTFPDIAAAIKVGHFDSGFHHWNKYGKKGGRSYYCKMASY